MMSPRGPRKIAIAIGALLIVALGALYVVTPTIERNLTFKPRPFDASRWTLPANTEDVFLTTDDGVRLHGWYYTAAEPKNGRTVLYFHGNAGSVPGVSGDARVRQARGVNVVAIDYRGDGQSEGPSASAATLRRDGIAAWRHLMRIGTRPEDLVLGGPSLGSVPAADLATRGPCRALILMAPLASARKQAHDMLPWLPDPLLFGRRSSLDVEDWVRRARCRTCIVHREGDRTIAYRHARAVYEAAREPKRFIGLPGDAHWLPMVDGRDYTREILEFLKTP
ncbi:MAG: alpha/beta hydrolase [Acidimicrobiia bacterium]